MRCVCIIRTNGKRVHTGMQYNWNGILSQMAPLDYTNFFSWKHLAFDMVLYLGLLKPLVNECI